MKTRRLSAIRQLVEEEPVHSQEVLRQRLSRMGFDVTQATLSRDIKELGLVKRSADGAYQAATGALSQLQLFVRDRCLGHDEQGLVMRSVSAERRPQYRKIRTRGSYHPASRVPAHLARRRPRPRSCSPAP